MYPIMCCILDDSNYLVADKDSLYTLHKNDDDDVPDWERCELQPQGRWCGAAAAATAATGGSSQTAKPSIEELTQHMALT